jgi:hypothetical protein
MALGFHLDGHLDGMKADVDLLHLTCDAAQQVRLARLVVPLVQAGPP